MQQSSSWVFESRKIRYSSHFPLYSHLWSQWTSCIPLPCPILEWRGRCGEGEGGEGIWIYQERRARQKTQAPEIALFHLPKSCLQLLLQDKGQTPRLQPTLWPHLFLFSCDSQIYCSQSCLFFCSSHTWTLCFQVFLSILASPSYPNRITWASRISGF